jgi:hypothetical protein
MNIEDEKKEKKYFLMSRLVPLWRAGLRFTSRVVRLTDHCDYSVKPSNSDIIFYGSSCLDFDMV